MPFSALEPTNTNLPAKIPDEPTSMAWTWDYREVGVVARRRHSAFGSQGPGWRNLEPGAMILKSSPVLLWHVRVT